MPGLVPPEPDRGVETMVQICFCRLRHNIILKKSTPERMREELIGIANSEEMTDQTGVIEIEFRALYNPLVEVAMMGTEQEDNKTGFQRGDPSSGRINRYSTVRSQGRMVQ